MLSNFLIVLQQVCVLFVLILIGYCLGRRRLFNDEVVGGMNALVLNLALPCTILRAFQLEHTPDMLRNFLLCIVASVALVFLFFAVAAPLARRFPRDERAVYVLSSAFTNCSFMGFPLQSALLGSVGILYSSAFVLVLNLVTFTVGYYYFTGDPKSVSPRQVFTRPAIIGTLLGLALFLLDIPLPGPVSDVVGHVANLAVPLPMFIIGYHLSQVDFRQALRNRRHWLFSALRLLVLPLLSLLLLRLLGLRGDVLLALAVSASCPAATAVTIIASRFSDKGPLSAELGAMQTLLSLFTLPAMLAVASLVM
ncbi:MAG: AEC family transporter [Oscillospiraceae bacterium]